MKYKIGDRFYCGWQPKDEEPNCKIEFITTDGRYGLSNSSDEYANQYEVVDEQELEKEYVFYEKPKETIEIFRGTGIDNEFVVKCSSKKTAEKIYNKMQAWKRLKEHGLKTEAENVSDRGSILNGFIDFDLHCYFCVYEGFGEDMDALFGVFGSEE